MRPLVVALVLSSAAPVLADPEDPLPPVFEPPRPSGFALFPHATDFTGDAYEVACGGARVLRDEDGWRVRVLRQDGSVAFERHREQDNMFAGSWDPTWCFDLDADGVPELGLYRQPGTSHGDSENWIVSLGRRPRVRVRWVNDGGNGMLTPANLDGSAPWELVADEDSEKPDGETCGTPADRPGFPVVLAARGRRYVRATGRYPEHLRALRAHLAGVLADPRYPWVGWCAWGAPILGLSLLLDDWSAVRTTLPLDEDDLRLLESIRPAVRRRMRGVLASGTPAGPR